MSTDLAEQVDHCSVCNAELIHYLCPTPGCFGLPDEILDRDMRQAMVLAEGSEAAKSLVPYISGQEEKFNYIAARYNGFSLQEALVEAGVSQEDLMTWRYHDPKFRQVEGALASLDRREIRRELNALRFLRNYHRVLSRDTLVLERAYRNELAEVGVSASDEAYIREIRKHYSPQQLEAIERMSLAESRPGEFEGIMDRVRNWRTRRVIIEEEVGEEHAS